MRLDVVRQPLLLAFATLLAFAAMAMACVGEAPLTPAESFGGPSLLGGFILQAQQAWPLAAKVLSAALAFFAGISLGRMTVRYSLYSVHTYLAMPFYGLFACMVFIENAFLIQYLASALLVFSLNGFYACYRSGTYGFDAIFRAAFFLGLIPLIYTPGVLLAAAVPLAVIVFKRSVRELLVAVVGYALPLFTLCYLNWAWNGPFSAPFETLSEAFMTQGTFSVPGLSPLTLTVLCMMLLLFVCAALSYLLDIYASGAKSRAILLFNLQLAFLAAAMYFVPCASPMLISLVAVPVAVVLPVLYVRLELWASLLLYLGVISLCLLRVCL